jgi:maltose O-acetyltransferase
MRLKIRRSTAKLFTIFKKSYLRFRGVKIGKGGFISPFCKIDIHRGNITIGNNVSITRGCIVLSHSGTESRLYNYNGRKRSNTTIIGDDVFIGVNTVILPGVKVGNNAIIGAGSIVTKNTEDNSVYAGNPAKKIRDL